MKETHEYDDIIDMKPPTAKNHPRMPRENRAAQFGAFAPLRAHGEAIKDTEIAAVPRAELETEMIYEDLINIQEEEF